MNAETEIDIRKHTFVDLYTVTRAQYYSRRKEAVAVAKDCFIYRHQGIDLLHVKDGENFYCGAVMPQVDPAKFEGINVVKTEDIYRIYIDKPISVAIDDPTNETTEQEADDTTPEAA